MYVHIQCKAFLLFPSNQRFIVGNRMGVADYKIGQEANSKQSSLIEVQVSLSTNMETDRQTDRPNYSNPRCACAPMVKLIYPPLSLDREWHW